MVSALPHLDRRSPAPARTRASLGPAFGDIASDAAGGDVVARPGTAFLFMSAERAIAGTESVMRLTLIANTARMDMAGTSEASESDA
jgi:hypothetical protein